MTWRAVIYGLAAWLLTAWTAAAQDIPDFVDVLVRPEHLAGRAFHHDGDAVEYGFVVVQFADESAATETFALATDVFAGFIADSERTTSEPYLGAEAVAHTGKTPYGHAAALLVRHDDRMLVALAIQPAGNPLPDLLAVVDSLEDADRPPARDVFDYLPQLRDLPPGFVMRAEHERDLAAERLATPVP